jgi:hypothetical protein
MASTEQIPNEDKALAEKLAKQEAKKKAFDREFRSLLKQSEDTIHSRYGVSIELGDDRAELQFLKRYLAIYNKTQPEDHYKYFETMYNRNRSEVLNTLKSDKWLREEKLVIQYGEGTKTTPELEEKRKQVRIMLSVIYNIAVDLQEKAQKRLDGFDEKMREGAGDKDLIRPSIITLHLFRIFYYLTDGSDKQPLGEIVSQIETELGVSKKTVDLAGVSSTATAPTGALSGLFTLATSMMEKMGVKPPEGMVPPTEDAIQNVIGKVMNNTVTQNAMQNMFSSLKDCNDLGQAIQTVVKQVTDPATMGAIQQTVMQSAEVTAQQNKQAAAAAAAASNPV